MPAKTGSEPRALRNRNGLTLGFTKSESGTMTPFTILVLLVMIIGAGIGADFMRYEAYRAELQNALDRGTLAATAFSQTEDPEVVVREYVRDSVRWDQLGIEPEIVVERFPADDSYFDPDVAERSVRAYANLEFGTYFIRFLEGVTNDSLTMVAGSSSSQRQKRTEVALVLDVSFSMDGNDTTLGEPKITVLKREAANFINQLLTPETKDATSITLIPFGGHVNPGPFGPLMTGVQPLAYPVSSTFTNVPFCPIFDDATEFSGINADEIDFAATRPQMAWFRAYGKTASNSTTGDIGWSWCPTAGSGIVPLTNDASDLIAGLNSMNMYAGTGVDAGLKWAAYLTSDESNAMVRAVAEANPDMIPEQFENRPAADTDSDTNKVIVFLTDGNITEQRAIKEELMVGTVEQLAILLDDAAEDDDHPYASRFNLSKRDDIIATMEAVVGPTGRLSDFWATVTDDTIPNNSRGNPNNKISTNNEGGLTNTHEIPRSRLQALTNVEGLCTRFRDRGNVQVYTIGFNIAGLESDSFTVPATPAAADSSSPAAYVLGHCAVDPSDDPDSSNRYLASGENLGEIFSGIAAEIFDLRLTN